MEGSNFKNLGVDGKMILRFISKHLGGGVYWSDLDQDTDGWWALVNAVMEPSVLI